MIPLDCIGNIAEYIHDGHDIMHLMITCKTVKKFIEEERPICCKNAIFSIVEIPETEKKFIYNVYFSIGNIEKIDPKHFVNIKNVEHIVGGNRDLTDEQLKQLKNLSGFIELDDYPYIKGKAFANLSKLKELYVYSYRKDLDTKYLNHLSNLEVLNFTGHCIPYVDGKDVRYLCKLRELEVGTMVINDERDLIDKKDLQYLSVCYIDDKVNERIFSKMTKLVSLFIKLGSPTITKKTFINLPSLQRLYMGEVCSIRDDDFKYIGKLLNEISLPFCTKITKVGLSYIKHDMTYLNLRNNKLIFEDDIIDNPHLYRKEGKNDIKVTLFGILRHRSICVNMVEYLPMSYVLSAKIKYGPQVNLYSIVV